MGDFAVSTCHIDGLKIIEPKVFGDKRGYFFESYNQRDFSNLGLDMEFVQDNQSLSTYGVVRGLHYQINFPQGKLVRVIVGKVFDVAVDIRDGSPTFGQWYGVELSEDNNKQFYIPPGFAHGFATLSDKAIFAYKCTDFYHPDDEGGIAWDDPTLNVTWPLDKHNILLSDKDKHWPRFNSFRK